MDVGRISVTVTRSIHVHLRAAAAASCLAVALHGRSFEDADSDRPRGVSSHRRAPQEERAHLQQENEHLREASRAFGDLAERLNLTLRAKRRGLTNQGPRR